MAIFKPHAYQQYCIGRLIAEPALILMLDMGLGKSVITLSAFNDLKFNRFAANKVLVIAPKKVAEATWQKEATKWEHLKHLKINTVLGTPKKRIMALNSPGDVWIINRENVEWLTEHYAQDWPFDMVVVDESTSFKNYRSKRWRALKRVRPYINRIVALTGTPAPNGLMDLWAQIYLLDEGERLGKTISAYRERFFRPDKRNATTIFSYAPKEEAETAIKSLIADISISMKSEDYLQLPEVVIDDIPVVLDGKALKQYAEMEREALLQVDQELITAAGAAALSNKLLQLCNGAVYGEDRQVIKIHDCKIEAFMELIEQLNGKPALVFYNFKHDLSRLEAALSKTSLRVQKLKGPDDERDWNERKIDILLAHPASCAYGLNLQDGGNHVIWFGLNWSLELYQQANKRLHRQGQQQKVIIHRLITQGGRDEDVVAALEDKESTQDNLLESLKARIQKAKKKEEH